jgi:hypothetical protein
MRHYLISDSEREKGAFNPAPSIKSIKYKALWIFFVQYLLQHSWRSSSKTNIYVSLILKKLEKF